jgi:hypothetical protein
VAPTKRGKAKRITVAVVLFATTAMVLFVERRVGHPNGSFMTSRDTAIHNPNWHAA